MITSENVLQHELVGLETTIIESTNPEFVNVKGTIVYETKSMLKINHSNQLKQYPKKNNTWEFSINGNKTSIEGFKIQKRPADRIGGKID